MHIADALLKPCMFALGGFKSGNLQETHFWHCHPISPQDIDRSLSVEVYGATDETTSNARFPFPFFHAPFWKGWRSYVVLEVGNFESHWHIGWVHEQYPAGSKPRHRIHRLPLKTSRVRMLKQSRGFVTAFFAINATGQQIPIRNIGEGQLGDLRFENVRLF